MSWSEDTGEHEGYVALVFADGLTGTWTSGNGVGVWPHWKTEKSSRDEQVRPYSEVVAWRVECSCGWEAQLCPLEDELDVDERWREPSGAREEEFRLEWAQHVRPFELMSELGRLAAEAHAIQRRINEEVDAVQAAGVSWAQIGRALGLTEHEARQRYGGQSRAS